MKRKILVTSALPYANGDLHLGHILEFIQTDIWVRYQKESGNHCIYISGDDSHGTPVMLNSYNKKISPETLIHMYFEQHILDLKNFNINIDKYYTTHSIENRDTLINIYKQLCNNDHIYKKEIFQLYDLEKKMFIPDRYVIGICPNCNQSDQCGDVCKKCNFKYESFDLINPISILTGSVPIKKKSDHYFFKLSKFEKFLKKWTKNNLSQLNVINKVNEWFLCGLKDWNISRDFPYFGISIPNTVNKYFYVWLDAPVGYISIFKKYADDTSINFLDYWNINSKTELYHFIGKDIIYFHALFWPSVLKGSGFRLPNDIFVHGFLTVNGKKMSKSDGSYLLAKNFLKYLDSDYLRYYFASKLNSGINDIDLNLYDLKNIINSHLVGKFLNILSRCMKLINIYHNNTLYNKIDDSLFSIYLNIKNDIKIFYEKREYYKVVNIILRYINNINSYIDIKKPWLLVKNKSTLDNSNFVCTTAINLFLILLINMKPILPIIFEKINKYFCISSLSWCKFNHPLLKIKVRKYNCFFKKITDNDIKMLLLL